MHSLQHVKIKLHSMCVPVVQRFSSFLMIYLALRHRLCLLVGRLNFPFTVFVKEQFWITENVKMKHTHEKWSFVCCSYFTESLLCVQCYHPPAQYITFPPKHTPASAEQVRMWVCGRWGHLMMSRVLRWWLIESDQT